MIDWSTVLLRCGVRAPVAGLWAPVFALVIKPGTFSAGDAELPDFLGQILHESGLLSRTEENLFYRTPERLCEVWPARFPTIGSALPFVSSPQALANKVYADRLGNGTEGSGDGWRYRGSGLIQVTGRDNFAACEAATGLPLVERPELLRAPGPECLRVCVAWWEGHIPDAALGDVVKVTRRVNGGTVGLADRMTMTRLAERALG